jgi:hypothetical protein
MGSTPLKSDIYLNNIIYPNLKKEYIMGSVGAFPIGKHPYQ